MVKKQCVIGSIGYYDLAKWGLLYDYLESGLNRAVEVFGVDYETLYGLVESKMQPVIDKIEREFRRSAEYKARRQREKLEKAYQKAKKQFAKKYNVDPDEYDYCYNIFGELMDEKYLNQIIRQYEQQQEAKRSYQESWRSTYEQYTSGGQSYGSYRFPTGSTYKDDETAILKKFYRELSKIYHPDLNPDRDTTAQMQMLNKLKEQWGI